MSTEIKFKREGLLFLGRNGSGECTGLDIASRYYNTFPNNLIVAPITSKGVVAKCYIEIPEEQAGEVAAALQEDLLSLVLDHIPDQLPTLLGLNPELDRIISEKLQKG